MGLRPGGRRDSSREETRVKPGEAETEELISSILLSAGKCVLYSAFRIPPFAFLLPFLMQLINSSSEFAVAVGDGIAGVMRAQMDLHLVVHVAPVGMVVMLLC